MIYTKKAIQDKFRENWDLFKNSRKRKYVLEYINSDENVNLEIRFILNDRKQIIEEDDDFIPDIMFHDKDMLTIIPNKTTIVFSNTHLHTGKVTNGNTQEEQIYMKYPELFITIIDKITIPENGVIYIPHINLVMMDATPPLKLAKPISRDFIKQIKL